MEKNPVYQLLKKVENSCIGGGDIAEDIKGALKLAMKDITWKGK